MAAKKSKVASYRHPHVPTIACFNRAKTPLGVDFDHLIAALQKYVDEHFAPIWGTPARLVKSTGFLKGKWALGFLDDADEAGTEGFHDVTPEGLPFAKIFVRSTLKLGDKVSVTASHEIAEMLVDPAANLYSSGPRKNHLYDYEVSDPVEELWFPVNGIPMVDFVYPEYFEVFHKPGSMRFDHMGALKRPFEIAKNGYQSFWVNGKEKTVWGCLKKKRKFLTEDRRGHRSTERRKPARKASASHWGALLRT
ncbi:MAG: hypothetical protein P4M04_15150 [Acidobacteriota bacterium]|nr:hypothetical protein [Acidobacteriota bacterium]